MAKIKIDGLGVIEIEGDNPSPGEIETIQKLLNKKTLETIPNIKDYKEKNQDA